MGQEEVKNGKPQITKFKPDAKWTCHYWKTTQLYCAWSFPLHPYSMKYRQQTPTKGKIKDDHRQVEFVPGTPIALAQKKVNWCNSPYQPTSYSVVCTNAGKAFKDLCGTEKRGRVRAFTWWLWCGSQGCVRTSKSAHFQHLHAGQFTSISLLIVGVGGVGPAFFKKRTKIRISFSNKNKPSLLSPDLTKYSFYA